MLILNSQISLDSFFFKLSISNSALLILDYDGTLAPFSKDPEKAKPYPGVCEKIEKIMQSKQTKVVILSGRSLQGLKSLLKMNPLPDLWGSHGGERQIRQTFEPTIQIIAPEIKDVLCKAAAEAQTLAPSLYCEIKPLSVALHWRGRDTEEMQEESKSVLSRWKSYLSGNSLEIHKFDGGVELRPKGINKGAAVKTLFKENPTDTLIAYLGDDYTDEEAFEVLGKQGLKILVRKTSRQTKADIQITPPDELLWFLERWIQNQKKEIS